MPTTVTAISTVETQTASEARELAAHMLSQAARAAILLIENNEPQLAADVLRLARDGWAVVWRAP